MIHRPAVIWTELEIAREAGNIKAGRPQGFKLALRFDRQATQTMTGSRRESKLQGTDEQKAMVDEQTQIGTLEHARHVTKNIEFKPR